jgi:hypothetical protein
VKQSESEARAHRPPPKRGGPARRAQHATWVLATCPIASVSPTFPTMLLLSGLQTYPYPRCLPPPARLPLQLRRCTTALCCKSQW